MKLHQCSILYNVNGNSKSFITSLSNILGFPPPDIVFDSYVRILDQRTEQIILEWTAERCLRGVQQNSPMSVSSSCSSVYPNTTSESKFDWTYSSFFSGLVQNYDFKESDSLDKNFISKGPIQFFKQMIIYEDEIGDLGRSLFSIRLRVTPFCLFVLSRSWVEFPGLFRRAIDHRWTKKHHQTSLECHTTIRETPYVPYSSWITDAWPRDALGPSAVPGISDSDPFADDATLKLSIVESKTNSMSYPWPQN